jgi:anti-sigma B factor antagonist
VANGRNGSAHDGAAPSIGASDVEQTAGDRSGAAGRRRRGVLINTLGSTSDAAPFEVTLVDGPEDGQVVAQVRGELDAATNPLLQRSLLRALRQATRLLTVDLSGVTFFGSAGVTALVWLSQHPEAAGKHVRVVATSRVVTGPLELTGLLDRLDVQGMPGPAPRPGERPAAPGS